MSVTSGSPIVNCQYFEGMINIGESLRKAQLPTTGVVNTLLSAENGGWIDQIEDSRGSNLNKKYQIKYRKPICTSTPPAPLSACSPIPTGTTTPNNLGVSDISFDSTPFTYAMQYSVRDVLDFCKEETSQKVFKELMAVDNDEMWNAYNNYMTNKLKANIGNYPNGVDSFALPIGVNFLTSKLTPNAQGMVAMNAMFTKFGVTKKPFVIADHLTYTQYMGGLTYAGLDSGGIDASKASTDNLIMDTNLSVNFGGKRVVAFVPQTIRVVSLLENTGENAIRDGVAEIGTGSEIQKIWKNDSKIVTLFTDKIQGGVKFDMFMTFDPCGLLKIQYQAKIEMVCLSSLPDSLCTPYCALSVIPTCGDNDCTDLDLGC